MKFTLAFLSGLMATTVVGLAIPSPQPEAEALAEPEAFAEPEALPDITSDLSDADIITTSAKGWAKDANLVSGFLDSVYFKRFRNQKQYLRAAKAALAAEEAEWALKETLADYLLNNPNCQAANSTLSDGDTWGNVKDLLQELTELDWVADQSRIQEILGEINFGDGSAGGRCDVIIPAFNQYFKCAKEALLTLLPGSTALSGYKAYTPRSCQAHSTRDVLEG